MGKNYAETSQLHLVMDIDQGRMPIATGPRQPYRDSSVISDAGPARK